MLGAEVAHLGAEKAPQTRPDGLFPKMLIFGMQEVKGQFWSILGLILFLFCMIFGYKLSNLSLSVIFCFLVFRRVWVCLGISKIQKKKKTVHLWPKIARYGNLLDFIKYLQAKVKTLSYIKNLEITKHLFIYRIINKNDRQS